MMPVQVNSDTPRDWASTRDAVSSSVMPPKLARKTIRYASRMSGKAWGFECGQGRQCGFRNSAPVGRSLPARRVVSQDTSVPTANRQQAPAATNTSVLMVNVGIR